MSTQGTLYLVPTPLGEGARAVGDPLLAEVLGSVRHFVVERAKPARAFLKSVVDGVAFRDLTIVEFDKHEPDRGLSVPIEWLTRGLSVGVLSDVGCPGIADPGAALVSRAHDAGVRVVPLIGPSSIVLALMASGLTGQRFRFVGYLPRELEPLTRELNRLEEESAKRNETIIAIETPYRTRRLLEHCIETLRPTTQLTIAQALSTPDELCRTRPVKSWRECHPYTVGDLPSVILFLGS